MPIIRYLAGENVDVRQALLDHRLSSWSGGPVLHLVPARGRVIDLESDHRFWLKRTHDTLTGLIYRIFEEDIRATGFKNCRLIDDHIRSLIIKKALKSKSSQPDGLIYFNRLLKDRDSRTEFPGIFRAIASFFTRLVQNNYQDRFADDLAGRIIRIEERDSIPGDEHYALENDLVWLFGEYEEIKKELHVYDADDVSSSVRDFLAIGRLPTPLGKTEVIIFDGFIDLTRLEEDIISSLFGHLKEIWWPLEYDGPSPDPVTAFKESSKARPKQSTENGGPSNSNRTIGMEAYRVFAPMAAFMDRLEASGFETLMEKGKAPVFLNPLAKGFYRDGHMGDVKDNTLRIRRFPGKSDEIKAIAREIKRIIHEDRLDPATDLGSIRIIFPELSEYSSLIFEIFREYGIPFSLTRGLPLLFHPMTDLFLLILKLPMDNFKISDIFRLFSSDIIGIKDPFFPQGHEKIALIYEPDLISGDDLHVVEGLTLKHDEKRPLKRPLDIGFIEMIAGQCGLKAIGDDPGDRGIPPVREFYSWRIQKGVTPREREALKTEYYAFIRQYRILIRILTPFKALLEQDTPGGIEKVLFELLEYLGFGQKIFELQGYAGSPDPFANEGIPLRDIKAYSMLKDLILKSSSELMFENALFNPSSNRDLLSGFCNIFRKRLEASYILDVQDPNVIRISQWLEIRGRSFDYIFAGGLTDNAFPLREQTDFISSLSSGGILRGADNREMSQHLFSHLLRNYRKALYLSCPLTVNEKEVRPSNIFADIEAMTSKNPFSMQDEKRPHTPFWWDDSPYISSGHEMFTPLHKRVSQKNGQQERLLSLGHVIVKDPSAVTGIIRGVRAMGSRWALNGIFEYDGLSEAADAFKEYLKTKNGVFSASQLDLLSNCPMRYLFERIYGLKGLETAGPDPSPMDMGTHIHGILSAFFHGLSSEGKNVSDIGISQAFSRAKAIAVEYFNSIPFFDRIDFFEHQKREILEGLEDGTDHAGSPMKREGNLALLLRFEERHFKDRIPAGVEYGFGIDGQTGPLLGDIRLKGYIDRFDIDRMDNGRFYLYDYKTGILPSTSLIKKGLSFQLPVYIRALKLLQKAERITASIYTVRKDNLQKDAPLGQHLCDHATESSSLDITGTFLMDRFADRLMKLIEKGHFHHSTDMEKCDHCDFMYACYRDERRMNHLIHSGADYGIYSGEGNLALWKEIDAFRAEWKKVIESMNKAFTLKTERGRKPHYDSVMAFLDRLVSSRASLPFEDGYLDGLIAEIEGFKERYLSPSPD